MAKVLVLGSGGREHALCKWFERDHSVYAAPGNAGTASLGTNILLDINDTGAIASVARHYGISLVVVGPEAPLVAGIVDRWYEMGLPREGIQIFGHPQKAAMLEGSKIFQREFATRNNIPVPGYIAFKNGDLEENLKEVRSGWTAWKKEGRDLYVVKADGLCGGKGVFVCNSDEQVFRAINSLAQFGAAGANFLLEERLVGEEASITVVSDGKDYKMFHHSQDHKRRYSAAEYSRMGLQTPNPNTGGMGAYAPTKLITPELEKTIEREIVRRTIDGARQEGLGLKGVLYSGVMIVDGKPYVIEDNMRFGDPESQVILPLADADPYDLMMGCIQGNLASVHFRRKNEFACCVVLCEENYPGKSKGKVTLELGSGLDYMQDVTVFHSSTRRENGRMVSEGGRVVGVTAVSPQSHSVAIRRAYEGAGQVKFLRKTFREDIGHKVME